MSLPEFRFDDRVVVVTGAGSGLGRAYALAFAQRGAKVVVNDIGSISHESKENEFAADLVVNEIVDAGGEAVPNHSSVEAGAKVIETALSEYGKVDILINNAGIASFMPFEEMSFEEWRAMLSVHIDGAFACSRAAWSSMRENNFGRIICTGSHGFLGFPGMTHYATAKAAMFGLTSGLAVEGTDHNIYCNMILPAAMTAMSKTPVPDSQQAKNHLVELEAKPEHVAQVAVLLCHESSRENGTFTEAGGGFVARLRIAQSRGLLVPDDEYSAETIAGRWTEICDLTEPNFPTEFKEAQITTRILKMKNRSPD